MIFPIQMAKASALHSIKNTPLWPPGVHLLVLLPGFGFTQPRCGLYRSGAIVARGSPMPGSQNRRQWTSSSCSSIMVLTEKQAGDGLYAALGVDPLHTVIYC